MWLPVIILKQIYNEKEQAGQKEIEKTYGLRRKGAPVSVMLSPVLTEIKVERKTDAKWNKRSDFGLRPHPAKLPTCGKELQESVPRE